MASIKEFLIQDHKCCDEIFAKMEEAVANKDDNVILRFEDFHKGMLHHFNMEEKVMFLAFEEETKMTQGPTEIMRSEHEQMRSVMIQMLQALEDKNSERFFGLSETLMMLTQQHNMKEEQMLYNMAEIHLKPQADDIIKKMKAI